MRLFVIRLFGYTTLLFLLLGVLDFFVFPENTNVMSIKNRLLKDKTAEILVLGNSHTFFG